MLSAWRVSINYLTNDNEAAVEVNRSKSKFQTRACLVLYRYWIRGWRWRRNPPAKQSIKPKKPSGFERSESGAAPAPPPHSLRRFTIIALLVVSAADGSRALRSSWRGRHRPVSRRGRALAFQSVFAACRAVTWHLYRWRFLQPVGPGPRGAADPDPAHSSALLPFPSGGSGFASRGTVAPGSWRSPRWNRSARMLPHFFVAMRSNSFLAQTRKRGETTRARLSRRKRQKQQMIRSPTH